MIQRRVFPLVAFAVAVAAMFGLRLPVAAEVVVLAVSALLLGICCAPYVFQSKVALRYSLAYQLNADASSMAPLPRRMIDLPSESSCIAAAGSSALFGSSSRWKEAAKWGTIRTSRARAAAIGSDASAPTAEKHSKTWIMVRPC